MPDVRIINIPAGELGEDDKLVVDRPGGTASASIAALRTQLGLAGPTRITGADDFTEGVGAWRIDKSGDGDVKVMSNGASVGLPGSAWLGLEPGTTGGSGQSKAARHFTGLVFDTDEPITLEARIASLFSGSADDTEYQWIIGLADQTSILTSLNNVAALRAEWDDGSSTRTHKLYLVKAGVPSSVTVTMPALGGELYWRVRLTLDQVDGVVLEAAAGEGAYAEIGSIATAPEPATYHPYVSAEPSGGDGDRLFLVSRLKWDATRSAADAGTGPNPVAVAAPGDVEGPSSSTDTAIALFDGTTGKLLKNSVVTVSGGGNIATAGTVDGRDVSVDGAALDAHVAAATPHSGHAVTSRAITAGAGLTGGGDLSADRSFAVDFAEVGDIAAVGAAAAEGVLDEAARGDHVHAHGDQAGGSLHAVAVGAAHGGAAAGFLSANDKDWIFERAKAVGYVDDMIGNIASQSNGIHIASLGGTGAAWAVLGGEHSLSAYGVSALSTGTQSTGRCCLSEYGASIFRWANGAIDYDVICRVPVLPDGTEDYILAFGIGNSFTAAPTIGAWFLIDRTVDTTPNWICRTANGASPESTTTAVALATGSYQRLSIRMNAAGTEVRFYINGTLVATHATTLPGTTQALATCTGIYKVAGSTSRSAYIDAANFKLTYGTPRAAGVE